MVSNCPASNVSKWTVKIKKKLKKKKLNLQSVASGEKTKIERH